MSGFLQALAARESGAAAGLTPRVASWFEPAPAYTPGAGLAPLLASRASGAEPLATPQANPDPAHAHPARTATAPAAAMAPSAMPSARVSGAALAPARTQMREQPAPATERKAAIVMAAPAAVATLTPPALPTLGAVLAGSVTSKARSVAGAALNASTDHETGAALNERARPRGALAREQAIGTLLAPPGAVVPTPGQRMAPGALLAAHSAEGRGAHPAPPQPTIQVTIGRLEVRAVQAAHTAHKAPAARPGTAPTSLDDYLARRNGGGRP